MDSLSGSLSAAQELFAAARHVEVFTGAGMSAESGLDTYRDATTGLWENVDPQAMASIDAWAKDPLTMWRWYYHRSTLAAQAEPNAGHLAIAGWATAVTSAGAATDATSTPKKITVTTQNIDNLHERAGSDEVIHLHGSLFAYRCAICARPWRGPVAEAEPPTCPLCGNLVRPGVVWFGEGLPHKEWETAVERMSTADLVIIVGTSGVVHPAAQLPAIAAEQGTPIIEVSPQPTELTWLADVWLEDTAAHALPLLTGA